ncbi:hypothetical protein Asal01_02654 [Fodinibius salicampi]
MNNNIFQIENKKSLPYKMEGFLYWFHILAAAVVLSNDAECLIYNIQYH